MRRISTFPDDGDTSIWILRSVLAKTMMSTSSQSSPQTCTPLYTCVRSTAVHWAMRCWIHLARARRTNGRSEMSQLIPRCIACVSSVWWWSNIILTTKFFDVKKHWHPHYHNFHSMSNRNWEIPIMNILRCIKHQRKKLCPGCILCLFICNFWNLSPRALSPKY